MRDSAVLNFGFCDENGFIRQIVVDFDFADAVILESALYDMLLEECIKAEDLPVVLDPGGLNPRDRLVLGVLAFLLEAQI